MRIAVRVVVFAAFVYAIIVAVMLSQRAGFIYRSDPGAADARAVRGLGTIDTFAGADGTPIVYFEGGGADSPPLMHFVGNSGNLGRAERHMRIFSQHGGFRVAVMNYRGSGGQPGRPSEEAILADAVALYDRLAGDTPPVVYGTSLGAAVAVGLSERRPVRALVLRSPSAELCQVAERQFQWLPACLVMWDERWDNVDRIAEVDAPVLILHGARDATIPLAEVERLADAAPDARLVAYPEGGHNDLSRHGANEEIMEFLRGL